MRIRLSQSGGFAGVPVALADVETAAMPPGEAERLERLVGEAGFFGLPARVDPGRAAVGADVGLRYELAVEDAGRQHTVSFPDPAAGAAPAAVAGLWAVADAVRRVAH